MGGFAIFLFLFLRAQFAQSAFDRGGVPLALSGLIGCAVQAALYLGLAELVELIAKTEWNTAKMAALMEAGGLPERPAEKTD